LRTAWPTYINASTFTISVSHKERNLLEVEESSDDLMNQISTSSSRVVESEIADAFPKNFSSLFMKESIPEKSSCSSQNNRNLIEKPSVTFEENDSIWSKLSCNV